MENLKYLLSAYFHQDWNHTHDTWQQVVDEFVTDDQATVTAVPGEIDQLLDTYRDSGVLSEALRNLGCDYAPSEGDRSWLLSVRDRIIDRQAKA